MEGTQEKCYFVGDWRIKEGRELEFKEAWEDFAQWTLEQRFADHPLELFQDLAEPRRFYALWRCGAAHSVEEWTRQTKYKEFVMRMRAFCEQCTPAIAQPVMAVQRQAVGRKD
jgi:hypothetical protein